MAAWGTEAESQLEAGGTQVDGDDLAVSTVDQGCNGSQSDGPTAEHGDAVTILDLGLVGRAHPDRQRFTERGDVEGQTLGHEEQPSPVHVGDQQLGGEASLLGSIADAAPLVVARMDHNPVTDPDRGDVGTDPLDRAGDLVAQAQGSTGRPGDASQADVGQITAADPAGSHRHQRVAWTGICRFDLVDPHVPRAVHSDLSHVPVSSGSRLEQEGHGVTDSGVDDLDSDAELVTVIGKRSRCNGPRPTAQLQGAARGREGGAGAGEVVTPEPDVVEVGVLIAGPHRARDLLDELEMGRLHRVADRRRQDEIVVVSVAVLDGVEVHDRSPGDAELVGESGLRLGQVGDDDADVVERGQRAGAHRSRYPPSTTSVWPVT